MASDEKQEKVEQQFDAFVKAAQRDLPMGERDYYDPKIGIGNALLALALAIRGLWKSNS